MDDLVKAVLERCLKLETQLLPVEFSESGEVTIWLPETLSADPLLAARVTERRRCMLLDDDTQEGLVQQLNTYSSVGSLNVTVERFNLPSAKTWVLAPDLEDSDLQTDLIALYGLEVKPSDMGFTASAEGQRAVSGATAGEALARAALQAESD
jgi:hypothetical protein